MTNIILTNISKLCSILLYQKAQMEKPNIQDIVIWYLYLHKTYELYKYALNELLVWK